MRALLHKRMNLGMLACVFALIVITLYMAFAFPYSPLHFNRRQSDTTELRAVIVIGREGEVSPAREAYLESLGEEPPEDWFTLGGPDQLTPVGKERLYLLGKFLRLEYYERLLRGNPRKLRVQAQDSDKCLESAQALLAGLLPPNVAENKWLWSSSSGSDDALARAWQPKAIHTTRETEDDLLSSRTRCLEMDASRASWKNSTRYAQLLNEFRHDLQVLRQNTGMALGDDLELALDIEEQLRARECFSAEPARASFSAAMPAWYTSTFASRLAHIADVTAGVRFGHAPSQRLFVGRLLDATIGDIFSKIRSDLTSGISLLNDNNADSSGTPASEVMAVAGGSDATSGSSDADAARRRSGGDRLRSALRRDLTVASTKLLPPEERARLKLAHHLEPSMFVYLTDKAHLTAIMASLGIYTSQPHYGAQLILELHFDPVNQIHFLRLFYLNSISHNVLPEPVRVQPIACADSIECSPQQFKHNLRHLTLDKQAWRHACQLGGLMDLPASPKPASLEPINQINQASTTESSSLEFVGPTERSDLGTTKTPTLAPVVTSSDQSTVPTREPTTTSPVDKLDELLTVGPTHTRPISSGLTASEASGAATQRPSDQAATTIFSSLTEVKATTTTLPPRRAVTTSTPSSATSSISQEEMLVQPTAAALAVSSGDVSSSVASDTTSAVDEPTTTPSDSGHNSTAPSQAVAVSTRDKEDHGTTREDDNDDDDEDDE